MERESNWGDLALAYASETNPDRKSRLSLDIWENFGKIPEARTWLRDYLLSPDPAALEHPALFFALSIFQHNPNREEILLATKYWDLEYNGCIEVTSAIINNGKNLLSSDERRDYVEKAKEMSERAKNDSRLRGGEYNFRGWFVEIVANFEGQDAINWLCDIVRSESVSPTANKAWNYATKFNPGKTASALMANLEIAPRDSFDRKSWVIENALVLIGEINKPENLVLVADTIIEVATITETHESEFADLERRRIRNGIEDLFKRKDARSKIELLVRKMPDCLSKTNLKNLIGTFNP